MFTAAPVVSAFVVVTPPSHKAAVVGSTTAVTSRLNLFKNKKPEDDLSYIETRDMTREEMQALNDENERVMQGELIGMTLFSLILSIPMLYLVWVGFFAETAEMNL
ncbi:hypothetical protein ACA910_004589 [Epithemia clementina (nom. ined.)]